MYMTFSFNFQTSLYVYEYFLYKKKKINKLVFDLVNINLYKTVLYLFFIKWELYLWY